MQTLETMGRSIKRIIAQIFIAVAEFLEVYAVGGRLKPISTASFHFASFLCMNVGDYSRFLIDV